MELYLQIIAAALVAHAAITLFNTTWSIFAGWRMEKRQALADQQHELAQREFQERLLANQESLAVGYEEISIASDRRTRAILMASGYSAEQADELLSKDDAEILSLVPQTNQDS